MRPPLLPYQRQFRLLLATSIVLLLTGLALLPEKMPLPWPPCAFKQLSGLPCPLCGGTRSAQAILHADWSRALYLNPLAFGAIALLVATAIILLAEALRARSLLNWPALPGVIHKGYPFVLGLLLGWWGAHIAFALSGPKTELVNLQHPIAKAVYRSLGGHPFHPEN